ncbi:MAG: DnaA/Hda family protein [Planctomycetota bacterium]|nr:DnaA/Hda family protein [Planctomycetota bacterium]
MTTRGKEIDVSLRGALTAELGVERYKLWFVDKTRFSRRDHTMTCHAANSFYQDWLRSNFRDAIERAAKSVLGNSVTVKFAIDNDLTSRAESPAQPSLDDPVESDFDDANMAENSGNDTGRGGSLRPIMQVHRGTPNPNVDLHPRRTSSSSVQSRTARSSESELCGTRTYASFEDFVIGHANRVAQASSCMVTESPGCLTPLFLHGCTGVGKTHLLESIWTSALAKQPAVRGLFLTAEQFTSLFLEALHHSGLPSFRRKYRNLDLLILDDIQFFGGKNATLGELLQTVETMLRRGGQVVLAADQPPAELQNFPQELRSRFSGGMVCKMLPPDLEMRKEIVRRYVSKREWVLEKEVQDLVANRITDSPREIFGALNRLQATEIATENPITLATAEDALADLFLYRSRAIRLIDIEKAVCDTFGLEPKSLRSARKIKSIVQPRMLAMWLARKYTRRGLNEIGTYFGNRSHATVISAQKRVNDWMDRGDVVQLANQACPVEDAIRRVESRMHA